MKRVELVQLGLGHVGRATAQIILEERKRWRERHGIEVGYHAVADTSGALVGEDLLPQAVNLKERGGKLSEHWALFDNLGMLRQLGVSAI